MPVLVLIRQPGCLNDLSDPFRGRAFSRVEAQRELQEFVREVVAAAVAGIGPDPQTVAVLEIASEQGYNLGKEWERLKELAEK